MAEPLMAGGAKPAVHEMGLPEQVAFLNTILESSTEYSIVAKALDATILAWNEGARRIYGYDPADVVGKASAFILHDPDDVKSGKAQAILDEALQGGRWSGELGRVRKDDGILDRGTAFLQKPYTRELLGRKVRQVLDSTK